MLSLSNLLCVHRADNESLCYSHRSAASENSPRPVVVWAVTEACNLRSVHCYAAAEPKAAPGELTTEKGRD
ncbi:MAG: hypothetical protein IT445_17200 [Phycisphaeraceae bacterium]|nr:hypothetical protein [Phycisphaeraceae bacterium]